MLCAARERAETDSCCKIREWRTTLNVNDPHHFQETSQEQEGSTCWLLFLSTSAILHHMLRCALREVIFKRQGLLSRGRVLTSLACLWMPSHLQLIRVTCCCLCPVTTVIIGQGLPSTTVLFLTCISVLLSIYLFSVCVKWAESSAHWEGPDWAVKCV